MNIDPYTRAGRQGARRSAPIVTHNTNPLPEAADEIYVGVGGDITLRLEGDTTDRTFKNVFGGISLYLRVTHVRTTGTAASSLIAIYYS